ncbi:MAG: CDP-diacylglycerol--glycerol-3-phosphate 3-phosphatidyltransferase [Oscillospiraceae bacterium]|nr:CDP-diacylglycerol--glycerol-3-phosphate 3-phosphatidyltransferase [Oscillospiraceae bacterium]
MNLPNKLTLSRIIMVPVFAVFAALAVKSRGNLMYLAAGIVFALASLTDMFDGKIARKYNLVTNFGKFADPLADKLLTTAAFLYMQQEGVCDPAVLILILAREFAVSGLRMIAAGSPGGAVIAANMWGKVKTALQMVAIAAFYFGCALWPESALLRTCASVLCWLCAAATLISGWTYFAASGHLLLETKSGRHSKV